MSLLNKLLPPPLTNPFFRSPGEALDAVIRPIQQQTGIPGSYQYIEQGIKKLLQPKAKEPASYYGPAYASSEALGIKPGGLRDYGPGYKEKELAAGQRAENFRRGAGFPGQSPADRAYEAEKSRVAQMTAQDPELQRYEKARAGAKTQEEMNAARDIGMQIWQQKYGSTPMGQPGGAVGMNNPLMQRTFGYQTGSAPDQQIGAPTLGPSPLVPQVDQSLNPASPSFIGGEGGPLMNFADENLTPEMIEAYQKQLLSQAASRK